MNLELMNHFTKIAEFFLSQIVQGNATFFISYKKQR